MDYMVHNIVWDSNASHLPTEAFVSWANGCNTQEEAIDLVSEIFDDILILSCQVREE